MRALKFAVLACAAVIAAPLAAQEREQDLSNPDSAFVNTTSRKAWQAHIEETERGYRIGNPDADAELIEFISYTCGHCASFAREGEGALDLVLLAPGKMSVEVRPVIRNALDLTVSLLVQCGDPKDFKNRHRMYLLSQDKWLTKAANAPAAQQAVWARADKTARVNAARALDLDDMLAKRGQSLAEINTCLMDDAAAQAIMAGGKADRAEFAVPGTPSFALDGNLLSGVHSWNALHPVLSARFAPKRDGQ